jgi:hypothetical protein
LHTGYKCIFNCSLAIIFLCSWSIESAVAQLKVFPIQRQAPVRDVIKTHNAIGARTKAIEPLTLPFWDDFSAPSGLFPDTLRWAQCYSVWVNNGMAINPPTINVATFDGLDSAGNAYNASDVFVTGYTDSLVSRTINLSDTGDKPVLLTERNSVFLSFFFQWQGNGEPPNEGDDLRLEFKDDEGIWIEALRIRYDDDHIYDRTKFYDTIVQVTGDSLFHKAFQFRFRSYGRRSGPYDTWNIDYVYLNKGRNLNDNSFPDRAVASSLSPMFGEYRSIPYRHFLESKKLDTIKFDLQNLKSVLSSVNYSASGQFINYFKDSPPVSYSKTFVSNRGIRPGADNRPAGTMAPFERVSSKYDTLLPDVNDAQQFNPAAKAVDVKIKIHLTSGDDKDDDGLNFLPIDFRVNDTISSTYHLQDQYAYDDGMAEYSAGLIEAGNLIAYQFDMLSTPDTLIAFDVYFPPYATPSTQNVDFTIYHDNNGKPDDDIWLRLLGLPVQPNTTGTFQRFKFFPALLIDEAKFYIGWKQPALGKVFVGLDIDNDSGDKIMVNYNGTWVQNTEVHGSLMIRPVFGKGSVGRETPIEAPQELSVALYPNPTQGSFYIDEKYDHLKIYNTAGLEVSFRSEPADQQRTRIHLNESTGIYLVRYATKKSKKIKSHKVMIMR